MCSALHSYDGEKSIVCNRFCFSAGRDPGVAFWMPELYTLYSIKQHAFVIDCNTARYRLNTAKPLLDPLKLMEAANVVLQIKSASSRLVTSPNNNRLLQSSGSIDTTSLYSTYSYTACPHIYAQPVTCSGLPP
jgi:hypothetical protein